MSKPKITRNALKAVIKECLIEILAEGISPDVSPKRATSKKRKPTSRPRRQVAPSSPTFDSAVNRTTSNLTSDPVMAAIFEDTARTTLQEQRESPGAMTAAPVSGAESDTPGKPEDLFEGSSNWATLAFAEKKPV